MLAPIILHPGIQIGSEVSDNATVGRTTVDGACSLVPSDFKSLPADAQIRGSLPGRKVVQLRNRCLLGRLFYIDGFLFW